MEMISKCWLWICSLFVRGQQKQKSLSVPELLASRDLVGKQVTLRYPVGQNADEEDVVGEIASICIMGGQLIIQVSNYHLEYPCHAQLGDEPEPEVFPGPKILHYNLDSLIVIVESFGEDCLEIHDKADVQLDSGWYLGLGLINIQA